MKKKLIEAMAVTGLVLAQSGVVAADTGPANPPPFMRHDGGPRASVERAAMNNLLAAELAASTGRDPAEISQLLESSPPPEVASQLGLSRDAMVQALQTAHTALIQRALAAGLITQAQAEKLASMPALAPPH
jgi:hypothetical protein